MSTRNGRIDGLRILVTGGSSGIGLTTAQRLGRAGARIVLLARGAGGLAAAKHGVRGFVRSFDAELRAARRPVSIALIAPGPVDTPFWRRAPTPDGRLPPQLRGAYRADGDAAVMTAAAVADVSVVGA